MTRFPPIRTSIAGVPVAELAEKFGTPLYVYNSQTILERVAELQSFDAIRYAQKACSNIAILDLLRRHDVLIDAVSTGEIRRAMAAGYATFGDPPPIIFTADVFDRESLSLAAELGLHVNCGSPDMIDQWAEKSPGSEITLRLNPGFGHGHSQKTNTGGEQSKHGIWHEQLQDSLRRAEHHGIAVTGLHMHIGSGSDMDHLRQVCTAMEKAAIDAGRRITAISAGGGLPVAYNEGDPAPDLEGYFQLWDAARKRLEERFQHPVRLEIEPGRYLVAESGYLISEIRAVKEQGKNSFYVVDAGFNNLARPILYGAYHPISMCPANGQAVERPHRSVIVGGPLCESGDIFTQSSGGFVEPRNLPAAEVGDFLVLECAGAYGFVMSSNYNSKPLCAEVMIRHGRPELIRARQQFEDLIRGESIPSE